MTTPLPIKGADKLPSKWSFTEDLGGYDMPIRLEGEIGDVMVRGTIPDSVDGTFYRVAQDHYTPPDGLIPLAGHGSVSAFRVHKGQVDFKTRYVHNDRYKLERNRKKSLWADLLYHPLSQHPCVRAVIDSTSNTNVIHWGGKLLALQELGPAFIMDPDTLETTGVDPFGNQIITTAFTAHPHVDPHVEEIVTYGVNRAQMEITSYSVDRQGVVKNEHRIKQSKPGGIHDIAMTENWLVFCQWPVSPNLAGKPGDSAVVWDTDRPAMFVVAPRRPASPLQGSGWKPYEHRTYTHYINSENVHTAGAWEEDGKIFFEGTWPHDCLFPFWSKKDGKPHSNTTVVDLVRVEIDPNKPTDTEISDPVVLVDIPNEFPRIDERFHCRKYDHIFMNVFYSETEKSLRNKHIFEGLNATAMLIKSTGELKVYYPGPKCRCQEPVFIPRSDDAPEGDGYVIFAVDRLEINLTNVVILDTKDFENPIAVIELPMRMRAQIHGNWVDARELSGKPLVIPPPLDHITWYHRPQAPGIPVTKETEGQLPTKSGVEVAA
ncbi:lignostilbene dioxygenase family protein [Lophiostoma macrostomum CBS 122681]|uniref:Lignostilbene dioxygenase family protein n=1 Tax=Lophiostoma macrostomum CBS 122681 TaxID=1314788 RepID=A0A6A6T6H3_9PLEO|nr:lignostilbene dioxygenase family protein [Lophiostoma macrostomum CBS 122681]